MPEVAQWQLAFRGTQVSERKPKAKKIRRRRTTGRVGGTTQSAFASQSMSDLLQKQQADAPARKKGKAAIQSDEAKAPGKDDEEGADS